MADEITYKNSGAFGDLIYSLAVIPKLGPGHFLVAMDNLMNSCKSFGYNTEEKKTGLMHQSYFLDAHFDLIAPLLEQQSYITGVSKWRAGDPEPTYDLDNFRGIFKSIAPEMNYLEYFYKTFEIPYTDHDIHGTKWLTASKIEYAPVVVARTFRYRDPESEKYHKELATLGHFDRNAVFIGTPEEHQDYQKMVDMKIHRHEITDFLEMAGIINGAQFLVSNQTMAFALAMGLGKRAYLETEKSRHLEDNECYFKRPNVEYF